MSEVLVLGGGFAGLSAAVHLAAAGLEVVLIEQQSTVGGKAGQVVMDGFRFDTGPSLFTMPQVLEETFAAAGRELPLADKTELGRQLVALIAERYHAQG